MIRNLRFQEAFVKHCPYNAPGGPYNAPGGPHNAPGGLAQIDFNALHVCNNRTFHDNVRPIFPILRAQTAPLKLR